MFDLSKTELNDEEYICTTVSINIQICFSVYVQQAHLAAKVSSSLVTSLIQYLHPWEVAYGAV